MATGASRVFAVGVVVITCFGLASMVVDNALQLACQEAVLPASGGNCPPGATVDIETVDGADRIVCRCEATTEVSP